MSIKLDKKHLSSLAYTNCTTSTHLATEYRKKYIFLEKRYLHQCRFLSEVSVCPAHSAVIGWSYDVGIQK